MNYEQLHSWYCEGGTKWRKKLNEQYLVIIKGTFFVYRVWYCSDSSATVFSHTDACCLFERNQSFTLVEQSKYWGDPFGKNSGVVKSNGVGVTSEITSEKEIGTMVSKKEER